MVSKSYACGSKKILHIKIMSKKLIILDETLKSYDGHAYFYNKVLWQSSAISKFSSVEIFGHPNFDNSVASYPIMELKSIPAGSLFLKASSKLGYFGRIFKVIWCVINFTFYFIAQLIQQRNSAINVSFLFQYFSIFYFPSLVLAAVLTDFLLPSKFHHLIVLRYSPDHYGLMSRLWLHFWLRAVCSVQCVHVFVDSEELQRDYLAFEPKLVVRVLPVPVFLDGKNVTSAPDNDEVTVGFIGATRADKGFHLLPELISRIKTSEEVSFTKLNFIIQVNSDYDAHLKEVIDKLKSYENTGSVNGLTVRLIDGPLPELKYNELLNSLSINLAPYISSKYKSSTSGIFFECISRGIPTVTFHNTTIASQIRLAQESGFLVGCEAGSPNEMVEAIRRISSNLDKARADCIEYYNFKFGLDPGARLLDILNAAGH